MCDSDIKRASRYSREALDFYITTRNKRGGTEFFLDNNSKKRHSFNRVSSLSSGNFLRRKRMNKLTQALLVAAALVVTAPLAYAADDLTYKEGNKVYFVGVMCSSKAAMWTYAARATKNLSLMPGPINVASACRRSLGIRVVLNKKHGSFTKSGLIYEVWSAQALGYGIGIHQTSFSVPKETYVNLRVGSGV